MRIRRAGLLLAVALVLAGCGGTASQSTGEKLESQLDSSIDAVLGDEGFGDARHVECLASPDRSSFSCTADIPLGPDVYREDLTVTVGPDGCWEARPSELERLTGRDADTLAVRHRLTGCLGQ